MQVLEYDFLVIGSGLAGLTAALHLAESGSVMLVTKRELLESSSDWAQGGVACVMDPEDHPESHIEDTLATGGGLGDEQAVRSVIHYSHAAIRWLENLGVRFERKPNSPEYDLGQEAGHSARRVLHAGDITGHEIIRVMTERVRAHPSIEVREHTIGIDLVTTGWLGHPCTNHSLGCYFLDERAGTVFAVRAPHTLLATGGAGKVYLYTSNPDVATGDGIAMAWRAGVPVKNMEFVQFHPTCLYHPKAKSFLISEALRGEGGRLRNRAGELFMEKYDARAELAPRDIVARAIDQEIKMRGDPCAFLDMTHQTKDFLVRRFPNIYTRCFDLGIDMASDPIPVVPAAHYFCGGVEAAVNGVTALPGLYVCGEAACTGMHGANRLASNSLLEALVCAQLTAQTMISLQKEGEDRSMEVDIPDWRSGDAVPSDEAVVVEHNWNEIRTFMWDYVGIVRTDKRLERAKRRIRNVRREIRQYYLDYLITRDVLELRNIAAVAELVIRSAEMRRESRGLHFTLDCPEPSNTVPCDTRIVDQPGDASTLT